MIKMPRGTKDILPDESYKWQYVEDVIKGVCRDFNFKEIRFPTFEHTELFQRGVGDTTDVVQKEMYTFSDKDNRSLTLRPEGTAGVMRSFVEHGLYGGALPLKLFYLISCFRYEKPQAGRLREFHQFGVELLGSPSPASDAEV
ncbi:MAG: histidine--tRNA ligase, partial [Clostridia bacterium]|nr:histidine--tRNA ligase [Clostridia bacterium]